MATSHLSPLYFSPPALTVTSETRSSKLIGPPSFPPYTRPLLPVSRPLLTKNGHWCLPLPPCGLCHLLLRPVSLCTPCLFGVGTEWGERAFRLRPWKRWSNRSQIPQDRTRSAVSCREVYGARPEN